MIERMWEEAATVMRKVWNRCPLWLVSIEAVRVVFHTTLSGD